MENYLDYLRTKLLWNHLQINLISKDETSEESSDGLKFSLAASLLKTTDDTKDISNNNPGGISSNDIARYGAWPAKFGPNVMDALLESLDRTLNDVTLYFHAADGEWFCRVARVASVEFANIFCKELSPDHAEVQTLALSLPDDVGKEVAHKQVEFQEVCLRLNTVLDLYRETTDSQACLNTTLHEKLETLPASTNANHTALHDLLAITIETSLLKLCVARTRLRASLYDYSAPTYPRTTISTAIQHLYEVLMAHQRTLESQERDVQSRLNDYQQLLELVDGKGGGFAQVVEDMATVKRETEDCRKDLRRLGWTDS